MEQLKYLLMYISYGLAGVLGAVGLHWLTFSGTIKILELITYVL